ncbi:DMT family transporter [Sphaerisporangium album]|uniref:DMT family transporter n=1 Tax=Sphaerisporangium album TaxID=509200 RepID=UPI0015F00D33|nr:DMT family transporter [Sphaerisporangium album]
MSRRDGVLLVLLGAIWGAIYPLTAVVLRDLPVSVVVIARTGLAAIVLTPLALRSGALKAVRGRWRAVLVAALVQVAIPLALLTGAQQYVSAGLAAILVATQPVWAAVLSATFNNAVRVRQMTGVLIGLSGVIVLFLGDIDIGSSSGWAAVALVAAAVFIAAGALWVERTLSDVPALGIATAAMAISTVVIAPFAAVVTISPPPPSTLGLLLILSVVSTAGALVLFYTLIRRIGAVRANLAGYLDPGFAIGYSIIFLGDRATPTALIGLFFILAGSYIGAMSR